MIFGRRLGLAVVFCLLVPAGLAVGDSIPKDKVDESKIYHGSASSFETPAEVNIEKVLEATPEYKEISKDKIKRGTGKYWLLQGDASNRAIKAIKEVAEKTDFDLIAQKGYLGKLKPPIESEDITKLVVEKVEG